MDHTGLAAGSSGPKELKDDATCPTPRRNASNGQCGWVMERTQSWMNGYGKLRRCTERNGAVVDFYLFLAAAFVTVRALIREARQHFRWPDRPTTRRLK